MFDNLLMALPIIVIAAIALWLVNRRRIKRGQPRYVDHIEDELKASKWLRRRIESAKPYIANAVAWINAILASRVITSVLLTLSLFSLVFGIDWAGINWLPPERNEEAIAWERKLGYVVIATIAIMPFALALAFYVYLRTKRGQSPLPLWPGILVGIVLIGIIDWFR